MNVDQLESKAKQVLRDCKLELKRRRNFSPLFRCYYSAGGTHRDFRIPQGTELLMNDGEAKEILFDWFRQHTAKGGVDAWVFATDIYWAKATAEGVRHREEWAKYQDTGFETLAKMGWVTVEEAIGITAQTESGVILMQQFYTRNPEIEFLGPPQTQRTTQSDFGGRQKMWHATRDDITGCDPNRAAGAVGIDMLKSGVSG